MRKPLANGLAVVAAAVVATGVYLAFGAADCRVLDQGGCPSHSWVFTVMWVAGVVAEIALVGYGTAVALPAIFVGAGVGAILAGTAGPAPGSDGELVGLGVMLLATPLLLASVIVALIALLTYAKRRQTERLGRAGVEGTATVVSVLDEGAVNGLAKVRMRLRVEPTGGVRAPFEVERPALFDRFSVPRAGDRYAVLVDPADPMVWDFAPGDGPGARTRIRNLVDIARRAGGRPVPAPVRTAADVVAELSRLKEQHARGDLSADEFATRAGSLLPPA